METKRTRTRKPILHRGEHEGNATLRSRLSAGVKTKRLGQIKISQFGTKYVCWDIGKGMGPHRAKNDFPAAVKSIRLNCNSKTQNAIASNIVIKIPQQLE